MGDIRLGEVSPLCLRIWQKVGADIFLLIGDYFSKYPEVISICGLTAKHVVEVLKSVFATYGIPKELFMDNMPFASPELRKFAQERGVQGYDLQPYISSI